MEFKNLNDVISSKSEAVLKAKEDATNHVKSVLDGKDVSTNFEDFEGFLCSNCVEREECGLNFKNCTYPVSSTTYVKLASKAKREILKYVFCKLIISNTDDFIRRRFAVREARRYRELLKHEDSEFLKFLAEDFGIKVIVNGLYRVELTDYLKGAVKIKSDDWKLVNRELVNGFVLLKKDEFIRLLEEFIKDRLQEVVPIKYNVNIGVEIKKFDTEKLPIDVDCFPNCMKKIIADLNSGVNVPHSGRFAIASFLLNIGFDVDRVVEVFRNAPDFDEEKTRYQVEHIAGMRGKGEEYTCPNCDTMKSWGLCGWDCGVNHPIKFYKRCLNERRRRSKRSSKHKSRTQDNT